MLPHTALPPEAWPGSDLYRYHRLSTDRHSQSYCIPTLLLAKRSPPKTGKDMPFPPYHLVLVLPLLSPTLSKTCCSSPKPSQPILCSSRNSCILRGLGNTSGISTGNPESEKLIRDPRHRGGMPAHPGQQGQQGRKKYYRGEESHQMVDV